MALDKTKVIYQIYPKSYRDTTGISEASLKNALSVRTRRGYGLA